MRKRIVVAVLACAFACSAVLGYLLWGPEIGTPPPSRPKEHAGLFPICRDNLWGYIDRTGKVVIEPQYKTACDFSEGLAAFYVGGEWVEDKGYGGRKVPNGGKFGYIDATGKLVIDARFDLAEKFSEGLAAVNLGGQWHPGPPGGMGPPPPPPGGKWGFIDKTGKIIVEPRFEHFEPAIGNFSEGLAHVFSDGSWDYIDKEGRTVIKSAGTGRFSDGLARAVMRTADGHKFGYIDKTGRTAIQPRFDRAEDFSEGLAAVQVGEQWGFINRSGRVVIRPHFDLACPFIEGVAGVRVVVDGKFKWGYVNRRGWWVIKPELTQSFWFSEGLAVTESDGKHGYIDKTGKFVIETKFGMNSSFSGGLARVPEGYIDKTGKLVWGVAKDAAK